MLQLIVIENGIELTREFKNLKQIETELKDKNINYQMLRQIYNLSKNKEIKKKNECKVNNILQTVKIVDKIETNPFLELVLQNNPTINENKPKRGRPKKIINHTP